MNEKAINIFLEIFFEFQKSWEEWHINKIKEMRKKLINEISHKIVEQIVDNVEQIFDNQNRRKIIREIK